MRRWATACCALAIACGGPKQLDALDFVPPEAAVVARIHAPSLVKSGLVRKHLLDGRAGRELAELSTICGYDPLPRVEDVTIVMLPQGALRGEFVAVFEGRLDPNRMTACARALADRRAERLEATTWSGAKVLSRPGGRGAMAFVEGPRRFVLAGENHLVRSMLRRARTGAASIRTNQDVTELLDLLGAERPLRLIVRPTPALRDRVRGHLIAPLAPLLEARALAMGVSVGARLDLTLMARLPDAAAARRFARVAEQAAAEAEREPFIDWTALGAPLRSFAAEARGRDTIAVVSVSEHQIEDLLRAIEAPPP